MFSFFKKYTIDQYLENESKKILEKMPHASLGIGVFQNGKKYTRYFGKELTETNPIFEIASITKVFTGIVLSYYIETGKVTLKTSIGDILGSKHVLSSTIKNITLEELTTHTSGIPSLPEGWVKTAEDFEGFPKKFTKTEFLKYLENPGKIGKRGTLSYSNLGVGILGFCLEEICTEPLETLYQRYILGPLDMSYSGVSVQGNISGHSQGGEEKGYTDWGDGVLIGAGGLKSTLDDMLRFIEGNLGNIAYIQTAQKRIRGKDGGLGWIMPTIIDKIFGNKTIIWHDGATPGFSSYICIDIENKNGIILLCNQYTTLNILGIFLMRKLRKNNFIL